MSDAIRYIRDTPKPAGEHMIQVINRFGVLSADLSKTITVKGGMLGFPAAKEFCLLNYPGRDDMKLLLCVSDPELCFIVLPQRLENKIHELDHIKEACEDEGFSPDTTMLLLIVSARQEDGKRIISCNAKAPVFYDCANHTAKQKPLVQGNYGLRSPL